MCKQTDTLKNAALLLADIAVGTQNYLTDVLHCIKESGVAEIIAACEAGTAPDAAELAKGYGVPCGETVYDKQYRDHVRRGCVEAAKLAVDLVQERLSAELLRRLIFWETSYSPLHFELSESDIPGTFRESAIYKRICELEFEELHGRRDEYRHLNQERLCNMVKHFAERDAKQACLIIGMLIRRGYTADEVAPLFESLGESAREFCELVKNDAENY